MDKETAERLRKEHPNFTSPKDAAPFLGMSTRKLSELVAEGRAPYHQLGGNIGSTKRIVFNLYGTFDCLFERLPAGGIGTGSVLRKRTLERRQVGG